MVCHKGRHQSLERSRVHKVINRPASRRDFFARTEKTKIKFVFFFVPALETVRKWSILNSVRDDSRQTAGVSARAGFRIRLDFGAERLRGLKENEKGRKTGRKRQKAERSLRLEDSQALPRKSTKNLRGSFFQRKTKKTRGKKKMIYACPKCGVQYEIDQPGEYQCSQCNQVFIVEPQPQPMKIAQPVQPVQTEQKQHTIICPFCKSELPENVKKCSHCGEWLSQADKPKSLAIYLLLSFFFGHFGVAEFYAGRIANGWIIVLLALGGGFFAGVLSGSFAWQWDGSVL